MYEFENCAAKQLNFGTFVCVLLFCRIGVATSGNFLVLSALIADASVFDLLL